MQDIQNTKTMKIVYLIEDFAIKGGAERMISEKANTFTAVKGHDVTIVSIFSDSRPPAYPLNGVSFVSLGVPFAATDCSLLAKTMSRLRVLTSAAVRFNRLMSELRPDVIFFTLPMGALLLPLYRGNAKRVYESHSARQFTPYHSLFAPMELMADTVVCITEQDARQYARARNKRVIPNFINTPRHTAKDYGAKRALAAGRLEHPKGFDILIRCWKEIDKAHPDWRLDIYGEGSLRESLQQQIDQLGLSGKIRLCGRTEDMMQTYPRYSLMLATSRFEGFSLVLAEAQACGLPAVTFDFKYGAREIVADGITGTIVPQDDIQGFARAAIDMMASEDKRRSYGEEAARRTMRFSRDRVMEEWYRLLDDLSR